MSRKRAKVPGLDELVAGRSAPAPEDNPEVETAEGPEGKKSSRQKGETSHGAVGEGTADSEAGPPKPEQVTVYFAPETVNLIETARYQLRMEEGIKTTKSALVEACVLAAIRDQEWLKEQLAEEREDRAEETGKGGAGRRKNPA